MLTRRELCKIGVAVLAFPAALWGMLRRPKPVYHTITRLEFYIPHDYPKEPGAISLRSCGRLVELLGKMLPAVYEREKWVFRVKCPFTIEAPWKVRIENTKDGPGPFALLNWLDEHGDLWWKSEGSEGRTNVPAFMVLGKDEPSSAYCSRSEILCLSSV